MFHWTVQRFLVNVPMATGEEAAIVTVLNWSKDLEE